MSSAVFAQLTAECRYTLQRAAPSPLQITPLYGDLDPHLTHDPLSPSEPTIQTASPSVQPFFAPMTAECPYILQWDAPLPSNLPLFMGESGPPCNT